MLYDACVLYPAPLRDLLVRLANTGIVRARWSELILDECFRNILENRPDLKPESLKRTRELMTEAVPDCLVKGFDALVEGLDLPDPDDRHVLADAICAGAQSIVTFNLKDFPEEKLAPYNVEAKHPDEFVLDAIDLAPGLVTTVVSEQPQPLARAPARPHRTTRAGSCAGSWTPTESATRSSRARTTCARSPAASSCAASTSTRGCPSISASASPRSRGGSPSDSAWSHAAPRALALGAAHPQHGAPLRSHAARTAAARRCVL